MVISMTDKVDYHELNELGPGLIKTLDVFKRTQGIYARTKLALGKTPSFNIKVSCTQEGKVNYGANNSTKIYTSK
jgi:hypothetical protein